MSNNIDSNPNFNKKHNTIQTINIKLSQTIEKKNPPGFETSTGGTLNIVYKDGCKLVQGSNSLSFKTF